MEVNNLKAYLANIGMSQRDFCHLIDVNEKYLSSIIHGRRRPSRRLAKDIAYATDDLIRLPSKIRKNHKQETQSQQDQQNSISTI